MSGQDDAYREFRDARDLLLHHADDQDAARAAFTWPRPRWFNWAIDWFDRIAEDNDRVALRIVGQGELTFQELSRRSDRVAGWLLSQGVRRGEVVMLLMDNRIELWELMLALIKIRAVVAPAFITISPEELRTRIGRAGARHVIADHRIVPGLAVDGLVDGLQAKIIVGGEHEGWTGFANSEGHEGGYVPEGPTEADEPLFYYFTSGSTARPKLVVHTHVSYAIGHLASMYWNGLKPGDVHLNVSAPAWAKYPWSSLFGPWNAEATVVSMDSADATPERLAEVLRSGTVTSFCAPPSIWRALIRTGLPDGLPGLRHAVSVGEPLMGDVVEQVRKLAGVTVRNGFGQSEVTAMAGVTASSPAAPVSMGYPLPGYELVVVKPGTDEPAQEGELCLDLSNSPVGMMRGYLDPEDNATSHTPGGLYRTGDLARWDSDGSLVCLGRRKDVFDGPDGVPIAPLELEHVLVLHPAVAELSVVPVSEGTALLPKAYVVLSAGWNASRATAEVLFAYQREQLPAPKLVRFVEFVDDLPRTESGKVRREAVRSLRRSRNVEYTAELPTAQA
ncbi:AMP-binding protein [Streptomyces sp. NBC_00932]|uniref:AMP-binding protein n=1 Tax=Streptomyces sp. NBC_00932 TaxID=2903690 RepID=UPI003865D990|nr:AMP-binding protein [Streptomyces sp. NBC_00932]